MTMNILLGNDCSNPTFNGRYLVTDPMRFHEALTKCGELGGSLLNWNENSVRADLLAYSSSQGVDLWTDLRNMNGNHNCSGVDCVGKLRWY